MAFWCPHPCCWVTPAAVHLLRRVSALQTSVCNVLSVGFVIEQVKENVMEQKK